MARSFNLVSPVGLVLNVLLIPLVMVALWFGYGLLFCGLLFPALAGLFAFGFDGLLGILLDVADLASDLDLGHLYIPTLPTWWMVGCYLLLATVVGWRTERLSTHWGWRGFWGWLILGLVVGLVPNG